MRVLVLTGICILGCDDIELTNTEVRRVDEHISSDDIAAFLEIVDELPGRELPNLPPLLIPPPSWNPERTLPVAELVDAELISLQERWKTKPLLDLLPESRQLDRRLLRKHMNREQFLGLTLVIGAALSRSTIREDQKLNELVREGEAVVMELRKDERPFHKLPPEEMHEVLHRAAWVTRYDRARRLASIPEGNVRAVLRHSDRLVKLFPPELTENPFDSIADRLDAQGIPFEDLSGEESLDVLTWDPEEAIVGRDELPVRPAEPL